MRFLPPLIVVGLAVFATRIPGLVSGPPPSQTPLTQEAYVWQRTHTPEVRSAVERGGGKFQRLTFLAAELRWPARDWAAPPEIVRVKLDLPPADVCPAIGLALRVHAYHGSFAADSPATRHLAALALEVIKNAETGGHRVSELQLDFDAAESQLDSYALWLAELRRMVAPVPVAFTALPSWLDHPAAFARLARSAGGFVLQVHSLALPSSPAAISPLCEPAEALRAIRRAADAEVPFRVALPTYGYEVGFDPRGRFLGIAADGSARVWPAGATVRTVRADPAALASLVSGFQRQHPAQLTGLIWYRLPVDGERLNWPWPALAAVMQGRTPGARVHLEVASSPADPALLQITLRNSGDDDALSTPAASLNWSGARRVAADALAGFSFAAESATSARLEAPAGFRLPPGSTRPVGWLRFDHPPTSFHATPSL